MKAPLFACMQDKNMLAFEIWDAVRPELSWTHYRIISSVDNQLLERN